MGPGYTPGMKMSDYWHEAEKMAEAGNFQEALKRYVWFYYNSLEIDPRQYGPRLSFFMSSWVKFGKRYKPALRAIKKIRDKDTSLLLKGTGDKFTFNDVKGINRSLNENEKTIELFQFLSEKFPDLADSCWWMVKRYFFEFRELKIIKKYSTNLLDEYYLKKDRVIKVKKELDEILLLNSQKNEADSNRDFVVYESKESMNFFIESDVIEFLDLTICYLRIQLEEKRISEVVKVGKDAISVVNSLGTTDNFPEAVLEIKRIVSQNEK